MCPVALTKGLDHKCHICGIALKRGEIAAEVMGQYIDYNIRVAAAITIIFCSECWGKYCQHEEADQGDAILKRKEIEATAAEPRDQVPFRMTPEEAELIRQAYLKDNPFGIDLPSGDGFGL